MAIYYISAFGRYIVIAMLKRNRLPAAPVAQWIARRTSNPEAVGSSPTRGILFLLSIFSYKF